MNFVRGGHCTNPYNHDKESNQSKYYKGQKTCEKHSDEAPHGVYFFEQLQK